MKPQLLVLGLLFPVFSLLSQDKSLQHFPEKLQDSIALKNKLSNTKTIYQKKFYDSVIVLSEELLDRSIEIGFLRGAGEACFLKARGLNRVGRREKAIEMYTQAFEYFNTIEDHNRIASTYNNWGLLLKDGGKFREAIEIGEKALDHVQLTSNDKLKFHILNNLGNSYQSLALFKKASDMYYGALQIIKETNEFLNASQLQAEVYINLGIIYFEQKLYERSLEIYEEAKANLEKQGLKPQLGILYNNLSVAYIETENYKLAKKYLELALNISKELNNEVSMAICIDGFGTMHFRQENFDMAIDMHQAAIAKLEQYNVVSYLPSAYLGLGNTYLAIGQISKAKLSLIKGLQIALKSGQKVKELQLYEGLIDFYKTAGELEMALMYYDLHSALSHELNDQQIGRHIGQMELKDLLEKRDLALASLESEAALLQFQISRQNTWLISSITMTVVISVMFILFFRQHQLKTLNKSIILEQKILRAQLNPHFIFNALGAIQHYISLQASDKAALYLSKFSKLMRAVLESSRTGTNSLSNELEALKNYLDLQSLRFSGPFSYTIVVDNLIEPDLVYLPSLIMQPLVENAVEHGLLPKEGGELSINISQVNERIKIQVEDDGVGIDNTEHEATHGRDGAGLGMLITRERLALLNKQNIHFEVVNRTQYNPSLTGTIASLELPLIT